MGIGLRRAQSHRKHIIYLFNSQVDKDWTASWSPTLHLMRAGEWAPLGHLLFPRWAIDLIPRCIIYAQLQECGLARGKKASRRTGWSTCCFYIYSVMWCAQLQQHTRQNQSSCCCAPTHIPTAILFWCLCQRCVATRKKFARRLFPAGHLRCMITCSKYLLAGHVFILMSDVKVRERWLANQPVHCHSFSLMIQRVA